MGGMAALPLPAPFVGGAAMFTCHMATPPLGQATNSVAMPPMRPKSGDAMLVFA